ncbi:diaminobutyrate--2-oxoglutarate transaminase [Terrihabitans soli]
MLDRARGTELVDVNGRRYLDFLAGAGSLNYGHNNPVLKSALIKYIERDGITHSLDLHTAAKERFIEAMWCAILKPRKLDYVIQFTGPTGTNAVEAAMKLARKITGRTNIITFTNGFHGVSLGALAATGNKHHRKASGVPLQGTTVMPYDGYLGANIDTVQYIERLLDDPSSGVDLPAAVILECVQGEGGLNVARAPWLRRLKAMCEARDILFIVDDIQAGCGRTGTFFSFEEAGIHPDIVTLSKSLSGYGLPMAVVLIKREFDVWKPGEHNGTFRGNNHAFVTAAAALEHYWQTSKFTDEIAAKGEHLRRRLQRMEGRFGPHIRDTRGRGMMRGITCVDPAKADEIGARAFADGLIIERCGPHDEVLKCLMPLTTPEAELDEGLDILEQAAETVFRVSKAFEARSPKGISANPAPARIAVIARSTGASASKSTGIVKPGKAAVTRASGKKSRGQNGQLSA